MKKYVGFTHLIAGAAVGGLTALAAGDVTLMTFEEAVGNDGQVISTFYSGITFTADSSGSEWLFRDATTGNYNVSSWPSGEIMGSQGQFWIIGYGAATTALDDTGSSGRIVFDNADATFVELRYSFSGGGDATALLSLSAFNTADELIDIDGGGPNLRFANNNDDGPGTLSVQAPPGELIAYVIVSDGGNLWVIDNVMTDASDIVVGDEVCVRSQGYWRNHPNNWPVEQLALGDTTHTQDELLDILKRPVRGNGLLILSRQLIAAKLNQANGASTPVEVLEAIQDADELIGDLMPPPVGDGYLHPSVVGSVKDVLDDYNNGLIVGGPDACEGD